jgi:cytochrome b pre-mRNA-processing protein 3
MTPPGPSREICFSMFARLQKWRRRGQTSGAVLYARLSAQARKVSFYRDLGVADTADGRYAMIVLHMFLIMERLDTPTETTATVADTPPEELRRQLIEAFIDDMDQALREMGVGDLGVPPRVKKATAEMVSVVDQMTGAVRANNSELDLKRHLTSLIPPRDGSSVAIDQLAGYVEASRHNLRQQRLPEFSAGTMKFAALERDEMERP